MPSPTRVLETFHGLELVFEAPAANLVVTAQAALARPFKVHTLVIEGVTVEQAVEGEDRVVADGQELPTTTLIAVVYDGREQLASPVPADLFHPRHGIARIPVTTIAKTIEVSLTSALGSYVRVRFYGVRS